jgi:glycosyltransferase involved in cell wall biosynthesis
LANETITILSVQDRANFGAVVIGRNEGERLQRSLRSLCMAAIVIYVDSGSTDGSSHWARDHGAEVIDLDLRTPFTAARARNVGFKRLRERSPHLTYVQFIDGDCELVQSWPETALSFLRQDPRVGAACGRRRERFPERSVYNWLCDREWDTPVGEARAFGGDVMMRVDAIEAVGGYRDDIIAGEEPELAVRLRAAGWSIWRLDAEMTRHDAAMTRFSQWWQRTTRSGYAFALGAHLHGTRPERHWVWESRRAWFWGFLLPLSCLAMGLTYPPWGWTTLLIYPTQMLRQSLRQPGRPVDRATLALFQILARFPEAWGQIRFAHDKFAARQARLIEYK